MRALRTLLATVAVLIWIPAAAHAATDTFTVNDAVDAHDANVGDGICATDGGTCTLRAAIEEADENGNDTVINLPAGTYGVPLGSLFINANIQINGAGIDASIIDGSNMDESAPIFSGTERTFTLQDLTVTGARVGAINGSFTTVNLIRTAVTHNNGRSIVRISPEGSPTILVDHSRITENFGGIIVVLRGLGDGSLTMRDSEFSRNSSSFEDVATATMIDVRSRGSNAALTIERSTFADNQMGSGSGSDGMIYFRPNTRTSLTSTIGIADSTFSNNSMGFEGVGVLQVSPSTTAGSTAVTISGSKFEGNVGGNEGSGSAGAIGFYPSDHEGGPQTMSITDSSFIENVAGTIGGGVGGAIEWSPSNRTSKLTVRGSTFAGNRAGVEDGIGGGQGGAIEFDNGSMDIANTTFTGNRALGTNFGGGGGAIDMFDNSSTATFTNVTMVDNSITGTGRGGGIFVAPPNQERGALAAPGELPVVFTDSIVAGNTADEVLSRGAAQARVAEDCFGPIGSGGHNIEGAKTCGFDQVGDKQSTDPKLAPLADNGGPTQTRAIGKDSPAFDAGDDATCLKTDQRGVSRPQFAHCDIGAFELKAPPPVVTPAPAPAPQGGVQAETVHQCVSRRQFRIRLRVPKGARVVSAKVFVNGHRVSVRRGGRLTSTVNLRTLPRGKFSVKIVLELADGRTVQGTRRYHTCHTAIPPKRVPRV
jgi:hypothetical protein